MLSHALARAPASLLNALLLAPAPHRGVPFASALARALAPPRGFPGGQHEADAALTALVARTPELCIAARASAVLALSCAPVLAPRVRSAFERAVARVFFSTRGAALTQLKEAVDVGGARGGDLFSLVYARLHVSTRGAVLQHFAVEAAAARAAVSRSGGDGVATALVVDVDDTLVQGWADARFPRRARYPGAAAFVREMLAAARQDVRLQAAAGGAAGGDGGEGGLATTHAPAWPLSAGWWAALETGGASAVSPEPPRAEAGQTTDDLIAVLSALAPPPPQRAAPANASPALYPGSLFVVTARPADARGLVAARTLDHVRSAVDALPGHIVLLLGTLLGATSVGAIARGKADNFCRLRALWPEYAFVLVGDSGQGDAAAAATALDADLGGRASHRAHIHAALIHDIAPASPATGDGVSKDVYRARGLHFFESYVGAAATARARGLLDADAFHRVCAATVAELVATDFSRAPGARERALAATLAELHAARWPGVASLGAEWEAAGARIAVAHDAAAATRGAAPQHALAEDAASDKDLAWAAWTFSGSSSQ